MPDALALLQTRRSVSARNMTFPGPSADEVERLLTIATRVPDHGKLAPWRFVVFEGEARETAGARLAALRQARGEADDYVQAARSALSRAPLVVAVVSTAKPHPKIPEWEQVLSAGAVAMNLCHAAHAMGYGANWLTQWFAYDDEAKALFGIGPDERVAGFVHIGTPGEAPDDRPRPALAELVTRWQG